MTSKEKLDYIYQNIPVKEYYDKLKQCFEDLEKDLEVLEILKNNLRKKSMVLDEWHKCDLFLIDIYYDLSEYEQRMIEEWLENENKTKETN